ncbi:MAG: hypothetical protein WAZ96_02015 [Candidatus Moraniibacteriota bacterium]
MLIHFAFSLLAGLIVWRIWKKPFLAAIFGFFGGFLIDLDHFIDYYLAFGLDWKWQYFEKGNQFLKSGNIYVLFHAWEYAIILMLLLFIVKNKYARTIILSLALGIFFHLATDVVIDDMPIKSYSLNYRIAHDFKISQIVKAENYEKHQRRRLQMKFE